MVAFVWQGIALHLCLYLAVQSQQNNHQEEEACPERGEGQHDYSPRVGDECQARPCGEKGFQSGQQHGSGSGTAQLMQTRLRQLPGQGTACSHVASHSSYTSTMHETQASRRVEEPSRKGGKGDTASSSCIAVVRAGSQGKPLSPAEHNTSLGICHAGTSPPHRETAAA